MQGGGAIRIIIRDGLFHAALALGCASAVDGFRDEAIAQSISSNFDTASVESAVRRLAKEHGVDILFASGLLRGRTPSHVDYRGEFQSTLSQILQGSGASYKRSTDGTYYILKATSEVSRTAPSGLGLIDSAPIIVTARKRSELLEETPLSVTAVGASQIAANGARNLEDLLAFAPGVYFAQQGALRPGRVDDSVRFRGMTVNTGNPQEQLASAFIDGVPVSGGLQSIGFENIERVEVISGPQSAIFGRSTFGGAVNLVTRLPSDYLRGHAEGVFTADGDHDISSSIEGPIVRDILTGRLSGRVLHLYGDYPNPSVAGQRLGREDTVSLGGSLRLRLGDFQGSAQIRYAHDSDGPPAAWAFGVFEANCGPFGNGTRRTICGNLPPAQNARLGQNTADSTSLAQALATNGGSADFQPTAPTSFGLDRVSWNSSFHASLAIPSANILIDSNGGYNQVHRKILADGDLGPAPIFVTAYAMKSSDTSLELRVRTSASSQFNWSVGAAYFDQQYREVAAAIYPAYANPASYAPACRIAPISCNPATQIKSSPEGDLYLGTYPYFIGHVTTKALFGSTDFKVWRAIDVSLEGRREWDEVRDASLTSEKQMQNFSAWLFRSVISLHPFSRSTIYLSAANGNLPGGFNSNLKEASESGRKQLAALGAKDTLPQQRLVSIEVGLKLAGENTSLQASTYRMYWRNQRIRRTFSDAAIGRTFSYYETSGASDLSGLELKASWTPIRWLVLGSTVDIAAARYRSQSSLLALQVSGNSDVSGNSLPASPKLTGTLAATVAGTTARGVSWYGRGDALYRSKIYVDELNLATLPADISVNIRGGLRIRDFGVELFVTNLTQSRTPRFAAEQADISAYVPSFNLTYPGYITEARPSRKFGTKLSFTF